MSDLFVEPEDATPLTLEERRDLIPSHIAFRAELNEAEQENIARGQDWALARPRDLLTEKFIKDLHRRMLGDVWRWAGKFRTSERNLGIAFYGIPASLRQLLDDAKAWIEYRSYPPGEIAVRFHHRLVRHRRAGHRVHHPCEIAVRFHHRLVQIHPFPNGNGRHSRLMAGLLVLRLREERFTWGSASLQQAGNLRRRYIDALKAADNHDYAALIAFSRS